MRDVLVADQIDTLLRERNELSWAFVGASKAEVFRSVVKRIRVAQGACKKRTPKVRQVKKLGTFKTY